MVNYWLATIGHVYECYRTFPECYSVSHSYIFVPQRASDMRGIDLLLFPAIILGAMFLFLALRLVLYLFKDLFNI